MRKSGQRKSRESPLVRVQDLVLDQNIDNSLTQALSFYSVAPSSPPFPRHVFSPMRTSSGGYNLSRELRTRFQQFDDDASKFTDTLSLERSLQHSPTSLPISPMLIEGSFELSKSEMFGADVGQNSVLEIESMASTNQTSPKSEKSSPKLKMKRYNALANLTVRYHNLGNWPAESREPKVTILMIKINEEVIFRETVLEALKSALAVMDKRYWQYCVERIKATEANHTINSETLVTMRNFLFEAQKHVAVLIAHGRSLAIEVIEKVKQLRQLHARNVKTSAVVSIFWKEENYLLKIKNDMDFINESPTMRLWLGFSARELVVPPHSAVSALPSTANAITHTVNPHDPRAHWQRTNRQVYKDWFKRHEAYIQASWKSGKSKVIFKSDRRFLAQDTRASLGQLPSISLHTPSGTPGLTPNPSRPQSPHSGMNTEREEGPDHSRLPSAALTGRPRSSISTPPTPQSRKHSAKLVADTDSPALDLAVDTAAAAAEEEVANADDASVDDESVAESVSAERIVARILESLIHTLAAEAGEEDSQMSPTGSVASPIDANLSYSDDSMSRGDGEYFDLLRVDTDADPALGAGIGFDESSAAEAAEAVEDAKVADGVMETSTAQLAESSELTEQTHPEVSLVTATELEVPAPSEVVGIAMLDKVQSVAATIAPAGPVTVHAVQPQPPADPAIMQSKSQKQGDDPTPAASRRSSRDKVKSNGSDSRTINSGGSTASTKVQNDVPEWEQLCNYVKHSWGVMEVEEDVHDSNGGSFDHRKVAKHGGSDIDGHAHGGKHATIADHDHDHHHADRKQSISDPAVGFHDSLAGQSHKERVTVYHQGRSAAPLFWKTVDHNPLVVEAATGFEECFPTIYLVPPMPGDLLSRAEKCILMLRKEHATEQAIIAQRAFCEEHKHSVMSSLHASSQETLFTASQMMKSAEEGAMLRLRQQGTTELLTGVSLQHLSHSLSLDAGSLSSLMLPSTSQLLTRQRSTTGEQQLVESSADNVFLTSSLEQGDSQQLLPRAIEDSVLYPNVQSFGGYVDVSGFNFFRIEECSKVRQRIEEKILDGRKVVEYKEGELFPTIRPDRRGIREPDHDSVAWRHRHAVVMQCLIRRFLCKRRVMKLRVMSKFNRSAHKIRSLVIGFMWRYRQRQKYWEARFEAFVMRKMAVKRFRASMTLAAFFRKIVRARRQMREDDARAKLLREGALPSKHRHTLIPTTAMTPVSRNVRRKHGQVLADDGDGDGAHAHHERRPSRSHSPSKRANATSANTIDNAITDSSAPTASPDRAAATGAGRHVTISAQVTEYAKPTTPLAVSEHGARSAPSSRGTDVSQALTASSDPQETPYHSIFDAPIKQPTPSERLRSLEAAGPYEESKRREQLRNDALNLIARVNRGKIQQDTLHSCRLVPTQSVPNLSSTQAKMRKFATHEYAFLNVPAQAPPQSLIKSCSDVFVGPIPKRVAPPTRTSSPPLQTSQNMEVLRGSASTAAASASTVGTATAASSTDSHVHNGFRAIRIPRGGSFSAVATPHTSGKFTMAGNNVLNASIGNNMVMSSTSASASASVASTGNIRASLSKTRTSVSASESNSPQDTLRKSAQLGSFLHIGELQAAPGSAGHGGVAPLLKYNSTGLTLRSKKQQEAHDKADAEKAQLRNALLKYM